MPVTLTLNNIPDVVYERLLALADERGRSVESEAIACLAAVLLQRKENLSDQLSHVRELRARLCFMVTVDEVCSLKTEGRP